MNATKMICVDPQVFQALRRARGRHGTYNAVLRKLLGLPPCRTRRGRPPGMTFIVPSYLPNREEDS